MTLRWELNGDGAFSVNGIDGRLTGLGLQRVATPMFKLYVPNSLSFEAFAVPVDLILHLVLGTAPNIAFPGGAVAVAARSMRLGARLPTAAIILTMSATNPPLPLANFIRGSLPHWFNTSESTTTLLCDAARPRRRLTRDQIARLCRHKWRAGACPCDRHIANNRRRSRRPLVMACGGGAGQARAATGHGLAQSRLSAFPKLVHCASSWTRACSLTANCQSMRARVASFTFALRPRPFVWRPTLQWVGLLCESQSTSRLLQRHHHHQYQRRLRNCYGLAALPLPPPRSLSQTSALEEVVMM